MASVRKEGKGRASGMEVGPVNVWGAGREVWRAQEERGIMGTSRKQKWRDMGIKAHTSGGLVLCALSLSLSPGIIAAVSESARHHSEVSIIMLSSLFIMRQSLTGEVICPKWPSQQGQSRICSHAREEQEEAWDPTLHSGTHLSVRCSLDQKAGEGVQRYSSDYIGRVYRWNVRCPKCMKYGGGDDSTYTHHQERFLVLRKVCIHVCYSRWDQQSHHDYHYGK